MQYSLSLHWVSTLLHPRSSFSGRSGTITRSLDLTTGELPNKVLPVKREVRHITLVQRLIGFVLHLLSSLSTVTLPVVPTLVIVLLDNVSCILLWNLDVINVSESFLKGGLGEVLLHTHHGVQGDKLALFPLTFLGTLLKGVIIVHNHHRTTLSKSFVVSNLACSCLGEYIALYHIFNRRIRGPCLRASSYEPPRGP